jgi:uncharacterized protein (TIGR02246 family)
MKTFPFLVTLAAAVVSASPTRNPRTITRSRVGIALVVLAVGVGPAFAQSADETAIRKLPIDDWCAAEAARDLDAKMSLFTADAVLMVPGGEKLVGQQAIRTWHEAAWQENTVECSGTIDEVQVQGDWGFVLGTFATVLTPTDGGTPSEESGQFINISQRQADDSWKLARVIWNLD